MSIVEFGAEATLMRFPLICLQGVQLALLQKGNDFLSNRQKLTNRSLA